MGAVIARVPAGERSGCGLMEAMAMERDAPNARHAGNWPHIFEPFRGVAQRVADVFSPTADASHAADCYEINLELPGVDPDEIDVSLTDHLLTVKGEKRRTREEKGRHFYFSERGYGAFQRSFRLPADVDAGHVSAQHANGVLTIRMPRDRAAEAREHNIPIRAG